MNLEMSTAKYGDTVKIHCTGRLEDGQEFCNTKINRPIQITIGSGDLFSGIETGIVGMQIGESRTIALPPEEGYGRRIEKLVVKVNKDDLSEDILPYIGHQIEYKQPDGEQINLTITEIDKDTVTIDANHPLAGHNLFFNIELLEIQSHRSSLD